MIAALLERLPTERPGRNGRILWVLTLIAGAAGIAGWATQTLVGGVVALWSLAAAAALVAMVLPFRYALVSPLYMGVAGWLVDMLPFVILIGWGVVSLRWGIKVLRERRWPRGGRLIWIPIGLVFWTALGVVVITRLDFRHFLLLLGIQVIASAAVLATLDSVRGVSERMDLVRALLGFVVLLTVAVFAQWIGIDIETLQNGATRKRVEAAYGVDAFPNNIGMIKYARSINAGALEKQREMERVQARTAGLPDFEVFRPKFQAYENSLVVRFEGSARPYEQALGEADVSLLFDNVGLTPANTVPRMRSFPRNALTYAGICAALFPLAFLFVWRDAARRRWAWLAVACCLFGAAFSLARGAWVAIAIGLAYLFVDGSIDRRRKTQMVVAFVSAAIVITGVFFIKYRVNPVTGRAGGGESVATREDLYKDTLGILKGPLRYIVLGYGTEKPRTASGTVKEGSRYVPRAGTHSTYLNYLFRTGVPGLLGIVALYALAFLHVRTRTRDSDDTERDLSTLAGMAVVIAAAHAVILSLYVEPIYTLTISLLLGIALASASEKSTLLPRPATQ
ncbi:MAG TPA: O-antigen ligase family protein [Actinomycetota bacterium]|nr:O-antigen ligase family protein [Actinomycetota bacterium]